MKRSPNYGKPFFTFGFAPYPIVLFKHEKTDDWRDFAYQQGYTEMCFVTKPEDEFFVATQKRIYEIQGEHPDNEIGAIVVLIKHLKEFTA